MPERKTESVESMESISSVNPSWAIDPSQVDLSERISMICRYVRFEDGKVLFAKMDGICDTNHSRMAESYQRKPVSAGKIKIRQCPDSIREWGFFEEGSSGLRLPSLPDDETLIQEALGDVRYNVEAGY